MRRSEAIYRRALLTIAAVILLGSVIYVLGLSFGGAVFATVHLWRREGVFQTHHIRPWLIAATAAAVLLTLGWLLTELRLRALAGVADSERKARAAAADAQARLDESERERERLARDLERQQAEHERLAAGWRQQREWNRELREQVLRLQHRAGVLGSHEDIRELVLELTLGLVEAEKGLLLSNRGADDGKLRVVCAQGFHHDPQESALAQRFAAEVIERGTTIREDDQARMDAEKRSPADEEVHNLLAIPMYLLDDFAGVIVCANRPEGFDHLDQDVLLAVGDHAGAVLQNSRLHGDLRNAYLSTIRVLANAIELKDPELRGHCDDVSEYVLAVADRLEFDPRRREELIFASLLHDVGKLGISERILLKPGRLSDEERSVIQLHPRIGYQLVRQVPALQSLAPAVLHHHERFDGDGYPSRLRGETIPLEARIIAIADAFSAITTDRPYSRARTPEEACDELERCAGGQFDPAVVRLFVEEVRRNPPQDDSAQELPPDPEIELHRDGDFVLGARSFGITDSLTLLYSHRHFHESARAQAQRSALQGKPFMIVLGELTNLTEINLHSGFADGDAALQSAAAAFQRAASRCGGLAFRASGRRLAVICPDPDSEAVIDGLQEDLTDGPRISLTAATWREGEDGETVIERALETLQRAHLA